MFNWLSGGRSEPEFTELEDKEWTVISDVKSKATLISTPVVDVLSLDSSGEVSFLSSDLLPTWEKSPAVPLGPVSFQVVDGNLRLDLSLPILTGSVGVSANVASPKIGASVGNIYKATTPQIYKDGSIGVWIQDIMRNEKIY